MLAHVGCEDDLGSRFPGGARACRRLGATERIDAQARSCGRIHGHNWEKRPWTKGQPYTQYTGSQ